MRIFYRSIFLYPRSYSAISIVSRYISSSLKFISVQHRHLSLFPYNYDTLLILILYLITVKGQRSHNHFGCTLVRGSDDEFRYLIPSRIVTFPYFIHSTFFRLCYGERNPSSTNCDAKEAQKVTYSVNEKIEVPD